MAHARTNVSDLPDSLQILERFRAAHGKDIDLTLRRSYRDLLERLGNPYRKLPHTIHVAGTNGKGSTCAFIRAILEAAGFRVHVYTSPHLVSVHERIRLAGELISERELAQILLDCEKLSEPGSISYFEAITAAAFVAFAQHPADFVILEVGLGGRLDATNIIPHSSVTAITRLSYDHREYLGNTLAEIASEKAGIMRPETPCVTYPQPSHEALETLAEEARRHNAPLLIGGHDWSIQDLDHQQFRYVSGERQITLPYPALPGHHQLWNAGLAIAACNLLPIKIGDQPFQAAMQQVAWPARLQHLSHGKLAEQLPQGWELWLDGGHNDSAGEVLAHFLAEKSLHQPVHIIAGMLRTKHPDEFLGPILPHLDSVTTVPIVREPLALAAEDLRQQLTGMTGLPLATASDLTAAIRAIVSSHPQPGLVLICGSLYLAGQALRENSTTS